MTFSIANKISTSDRYQGGSIPVTNEPIGSSPYVILMWCPAATAFAGPGGNPSYFDTDTKLGGLAVMQIDSAGMNTPFIDRSILYNKGWSYSMQEVYGSNMDGFSEGGFVWSAQADVELLIPRANLVGGCYRGNLTYG
jgi:hypothetical protein